MYPFRYYVEKDGSKVQYESGVNYKGSDNDSGIPDTIPMPTIDVGMKGTFTKNPFTFNVGVKGDKWNEDENIFIVLEITYERRASHRNYYSGSTTSADTVVYYDGSEGNLEYQGSRTSWANMSKYTSGGETYDFKFIYGDGYER